MNMAKIFSKKFYEELPATSEAISVISTDALSTIPLGANEEWQINSLVISNGTTASDFVIADDTKEVLRISLTANQVIIINFLEIPITTSLVHSMSTAGATAKVTINYKRILNDA